MKGLQKDIVKMSTTAILGAVISMGAFWLVHIRHLVTRDEAEHMIETLSPYVAAQQIVDNQIARMDAVVANQTKLSEEAKDDFRELSREMSGMRADIAAVSARLDVLLSRGGPAGDG